MSGVAACLLRHLLREYMCVCVSVCACVRVGACTCACPVRDAAD